MLKIPDSFINVKYVASRIPGIEDQENLSLGANCQVFIYHLLKHFGKTIPNFRSSELWEDTITTEVVSEFYALDIMLYNKNPSSYGAHIGLYIGDGFVYHLSKENGVPKIEKHDELLTQSKYANFIGAKRVK